MSVAFASLNAVKRMLLLPQSETTLDPVLTLWINAASDDLEKISGRTFTKTSYSNEAHRGGRAQVLVSNPPIDPDEILQVKSWDPAVGVYTIFDPSDYDVNYAAGIIELAGGLLFPPGMVSAQVTYSGGYDVVGTGDDMYVDIGDKMASLIATLAVTEYRNQIGLIARADYEAIKEDVYDQFAIARGSL